MVGKDKKKGLVYVLTNPAFPDVKIGRVNGEIKELQRRIRQHSAGSVPKSFKLHYAIEVDDVVKAEKLLHAAFGEVRGNKKEFFDIPPERVKAAMQLILLSGKMGKDLREYIEHGKFPVASQERRRVRSEKPDPKEQLPKSEGQKSPPIDMFKIGIPNGAELTFNKDRSFTAIVVGPQKISFQGQEMTLTAAAREVFRKLGTPRKELSGSTHWEYKGDILSKIRARREKSAPKEQFPESGGVRHSAYRGENLALKERLPESERRQSPPINMFEIGISNGAELTFNKDRSFTAIVVGPQKISFQGQEMALTPAAREAFRRLGTPKRALRGPDYWEYNGEILSKIRARWDENKKG